MRGPSPISEAWAAVRAVRTPFVAIQLAMLATAGLYAASPTFRASLVGLAEFRAATGLLFAGGGMIVAGILVPEIARRLSGLRSELTSVRLTALYLVYFAALGVIVAVLYDGLALLLGEAQDLRGVTLRLLLDMGVFTPLVSMPIAALVFAWRDGDFQTANVMREIRSGEFKRRYVRLLVSCWLFWLPVLVAVYSMPLLLQLPLVLIAEAAWALMMLALERREAYRRPEAAV